MNTKIQNYHYALLGIVFFVGTAFTSVAQDTLKYKRWFTEKLNHPFGTFLTLKVEVVDGETLRDKIHQGDYLFRIKTVDSVLLPEPIIMEFKDVTGYFPSDLFKLNKYLNGVDTGYIDGETAEKNNAKYAGREFTIIAYESGEFRGLPDGYWKYTKSLIQDAGFYFRHYLVVFSDLTKGDWHDKRVEGK